MKSQLRTLLTFLIGWPLSLIALIIIIRLIMSRGAEIVTHISSINYLLIVMGSLCFFVYYLLAFIDYNFYHDCLINIFDRVTTSFKTQSLHDKQAL